MTDIPGIRLEDLRWKDDGPEESPKSRLLSTFHIGGNGMHLDAIEVHAPNLLQEAVDESHEDDLSYLYAGAGMTGNMETVEIDGRSYVLFAYPFS